jgi:hypothetical protein
MKRNPRHRLLAALLTFFALIVGAMLPISVASAASPSTSCPPGFVEEGPPFSNCFLAISAPESVVTGQVFTVHVAVTTDETGTVVAKSDPCSRVAVTIFIPDGEGSITEVANTSGGIATFNVVVTSSGTHSLTATATNTSSCHYVSDSVPFEAVDVPPGQPIAPCPDNVTCKQVTSGGTGSAATLFADSDGSFTDTKFIPFDAAEGCANLSPADPTNGVLTFNLTDPLASKTVIFALSSDLITNGIGRYNICWKSPKPFTPLGGGPLVTTGLLPNCKHNDVGPCVLFRTSGQGNVGFFGILAPAGDPQAYPGV